MLSIFNDQSHTAIKKVLDLASEKHRVIANNIANVNTPGFRRTELDFQDSLRNILNSGDVGALDEMTGGYVKPSTTQVRQDGNNVDLNIEMASMGNNALLYKVYAQFMKRRIGWLTEATRSPA